MSKLDAQRAMREAAYTAQQAGTTPTPRGRARMGAAQPPVAPPAPRTPRDAATVKPVSKAAGKSAGKAAAEAATGDTDPGASCGHRSMNGRTCTRPAGHTEKNHRYS